MPLLWRFHSGKEQNLSFCFSRCRSMDTDFRDNGVTGNLFVSQNCFDSGQDFICGCSRLSRQHRIVFISEIVERFHQLSLVSKIRRSQFWAAASRIGSEKGNVKSLPSVFGWTMDTPQNYAAGNTFRWLSGGSQQTPWCLLR